MKYVSPEIEIVKFRHISSILTASPVVTEDPFEDNEDGIIDGDGDDPFFDPFA